MFHVSNWIIDSHSWYLFDAWSLCPLESKASTENNDGFGITTFWWTMVGFLRSISNRVVKGIKDLTTFTWSLLPAWLVCSRSSYFFLHPARTCAENCTNSDAVRLTLSKIHHSASAKKFFRWMRGSFPKTWQRQVIWQASAFSMKRLCRCWKPVRSLLEEAHFKALEGWDLRSLIWWYKGITIDLQRHITIGTPKNLGWRVSRVSYCKSIPWNSLNHVKQQWSHYLFKLLKCRIKTSSWAI